MTGAKLLPPCPFCSWMTSTRDVVYDSVKMTYQVVCGRCGARGPRARKRGEAIEEWRLPLDSTRED